jgi:peptidoglycan/LPS O-acetylase OafA/YrhL
MAFSKRRVPELDGIRGLAILLVVIWHCVVVPLGRSSSHFLQFLSRMGIQTWSGVDLFFVLSGFLIGGILIDAKDSQNYFRTFYIRRVFRILPIYVAFLAAFPLCRWLSRIVNGTDLLAMPWYVYASFTQNFWLTNHPWNTWIGQTWSLAVEEQFYLTVPSLIWITPRKDLWKVALGCVTATLFFRSAMYLHFYPDWRAAAYTLLPCRADALMLGLLGAIMVRSPNILDVFHKRRKLLYLAAGCLGAPMVFLTFKGWGMMSTAMSTIGYTAMAMFYLSILLLAVTSNGTVKQMFSLGWMRWLGTIAYGLYLFHGPVLLFVFDAFEHRDPVLARPFDLMPMCTALVLSLLLSHLSWVFFESRLVRYGHRFVYLIPRSTPL